MKYLRSETIPSGRAEQGFTLVEILVAVLILSLGVLGLIGMESLALKNNHSAYQRTQATLLSYDLMDRIRANSGQISAYTGNVSSSATGTVAVDLWEWQTHLLEAMPSASHARSYDEGNNTFTVAISWADNREKDSSSDTTFSNSFRP